jgi:CRISPR-associated protein Cmr2
MQRILFALAFGQVQRFVEAARTTRDLWQGSHLMSRATAAALEKLVALVPAANVVFPAPSPAGADSRAVVGLPNKLVAVVVDEDPQALAQQIGVSVSAWWARQGQRLLEQLGTDASGVDADRFESQLREFSTPLAAWVVWPQGEPYSAALGRVQMLLDARKHTRTFEQSASGAEGDLLCSLDARRETVLRPGDIGEALRARFHIPLHEALDAPGLLKRLGDREQGFPAVARIALEPWVRNLSHEQELGLEAELRGIRKEGGEVSRYHAPPEHVVRDAQGAPTLQPNPVRRLPFDCELLLASRRREAMRMLAPDSVQAQSLRRLDKLIESMKAPREEGLYVAMLMADGDHLGRLLAHEGLTPQDHLRISAALARFAGNCAGWLASYGGVAVYAGGDDVLALCPVDGALAAAEQLAAEFSAALSPVLPLGHPDCERPTLSVGIAMGHVLHPLGELRARAARALKLAKLGSDGQGLRNAVALLVAPRSGAEVCVVGRRDEPWQGLRGPGLVARLELWASMFAAGLLSSSSSYDLASLVRGSPPTALRGEARRLVDRRTAAQVPAEFDAALGYLLDEPGSSGSAGHRRVANEWYVSRWLARHRVVGTRGAEALGQDTVPMVV